MPAHDPSEVLGGGREGGRGQSRGNAWDPCEYNEMNPLSHRSAGYWSLGCSRNGGRPFRGLVVHITYSHGPRGGPLEVQR